MKGSKEECEEFQIEAEELKIKGDKYKPALKSTFHPKPLERENKPGLCLKVSQESMSEVWEYNEEKDGYQIKSHVKIIKLNYN